MGQRNSSIAKSEANSSSSNSNEKNKHKLYHKLDTVEMNHFSASSSSSDYEDEDDEIVYVSASDRDKLLITGEGDEVRILQADDHHPVNGDAEESFISITLQIFFPFLIAGLGMVAAGLVLDVVQHWKVFEVVNELFILVPALLGLKGNLEMTLASRLSTQANLNRINSGMIRANLALIQCQAIVVGLLASVLAITIDWITEGVLNSDHALLLCAASLVTASLASFILGLVMVGVILASSRWRINPDNVATPIAASLGDLTTLALLSWIASLLFSDLDRDKWLAPVIISAFVLLVVPASVFVAKSDESTRKVLSEGWTPVLMAMLISSGGGLILDKAVTVFDGIAVFQPVMNGVGGNLAAVQASRISTHLHKSSSLMGVLPEEEAAAVCLNPAAIFTHKSHGRTALILISLVIPGHLLFTYAISFLEAGHTSPTTTFLLVYLSSAVLQVWILLHTAHWLIHWFWTVKVDPDNSAIPYLTALGDLLGGALLWMAFEVLYLIGDKDADVGDR